MWINAAAREAVRVAGFAIGSLARCDRVAIAVPMIAKTHFIDAARLANIAAGTGCVFVAAEANIALFNVDGTIFAIDDWCLRCGSSLAAGELNRTTVTCPGCNWRYDIKQGFLCALPALRIDRYEVKVVKSRIMLGGPLGKRRSK